MIICLLKERQISTIKICILALIATVRMICEELICTLMQRSANDIAESNITCANYPIDVRSVVAVRNSLVVVLPTTNKYSDHCWAGLVDDDESVSECKQNWSSRNI